VFDWVAGILAAGLVLAINTITIATLYGVITRPPGDGISPNAAQVLTTAFGGIIGVLGSYVGYRAGTQHHTTTTIEGAEDDSPAG
jgi:hypothetical protein